MSNNIELIIYFLSVLSCTLIITCATCPPSSYEDQTQCFDNQTFETINCSGNNKCELKLLDGFIIDETSGLAQVNFNPRLDCCYTHYEIELYVIPEIKNESDCFNENNQQYRLKMHTHKKYVRGNMTAEICTSNAKLEFKYVFTGCYHLVIIPAVNDETRSDKEEMKRFYFQTDYQLEQISIPHVMPQNRTSDASIFMTINHTLSNINPSFRMDIFCKDQCHHDEEEEYKFKIVKPVSSDSTHFQVCQAKLSSHQISVDCHMNYWNGTECQIKGLPGGQYELQISLIGETVRCTGNSDSVWKSNCIWKTSFIVPNVTSPESANRTEHTYSNWTNDLIIYSILSIFLLTIIAMIILFSYRKYLKKTLMRLNQQRQSDTDAETSEQQLIEKHKILLLYARDDQRFMDLMKTFHAALELNGNCEVNDLYEMKEQEHIQNPEKWLLQKLTNNKIVLVLTTCSQLRIEQQATSNHDYADSLFPYGVNYLLEKASVMRRKVFLVTFTSDRNDYELFNALNLHTTYKLPDNFYQLISNLFDLDIMKVRDNNRNVYEKIVNNCDEFQQFCKQNPDYLKNILNVQVRNEYLLKVDN